MINPEKDESSATLELDGKEEKRFKAVICGDGIHSLGKQTLFESDQVAKPVHSGFCLFYGLFQKYPKAMKYGGGKARPLVLLYVTLIHIQLRMRLI